MENTDGETRGHDVLMKTRSLDNLLGSGPCLRRWIQIREIGVGRIACHWASKICFGANESQRHGLSC